MIDKQGLSLLRRCVGIRVTDMVVPLLSVGEGRTFFNEIHIPVSDQQNQWVTISSKLLEGISLERLVQFHIDYVDFDENTADVPPELLNVRDNHFASNRITSAFDPSTICSFIDVFSASKIDVDGQQHEYDCAIVFRGSAQYSRVIRHNDFIHPPLHLMMSSNHREIWDIGMHYKRRAMITPNEVDLDPGPA